MYLDRQQRICNRKAAIAMLAIMLGVVAGLFSMSTPVWAGDGSSQWKGTVDARPEAVDEGDWTIGGRVFSVGEQTVIDAGAGPLDIGVCAKVQYVTAEDRLMAIQIRSIPANSCEEEGEDSGDDEEDGQPGHGDAMRVYGILDSMPEDGRLGVWLIEGEAYEVNAQTELEAEHGPFEAGACLKVKYQASETGRIAVEIETERQYRCDKDDEGGDPDDGESRSEARLFGLIISFPPELEGEWNVGGITIIADASTEFEQERVPFAKDVMVQVKFYTDELGIHHALEIESKFAVGNHGDDDHHGDDEGRKGHAYGLIEAWPDHNTAGPIGEWVIGGVPYLALPETRFVQRRHEFGVGVEVRVKYRIDADGRRIARVIRTTGRVGEVDRSSRSVLVSFVEEMPETGFDGAWKVGNVPLETTDTTHFDEHHGLLAVGAFVEVEYVTDDSSGEAVNYIIKM